MANVLNLALKKDVFEGLKNGTTNEILIEKTNWWKKRLMDEDTGRFKDFMSICASCGSADKYDYDIEKMELKGDNFVITVKVKKEEDITPEPINPENITPIVEKELKKPYAPPQTVVEDLGEVKEDDEEEEELISKNTEIGFEEVEEKKEQVIEESEILDMKKEIKEVKKDVVKEAVIKILQKYSTLKDVFVINHSRVVIRNTGQILGCNKKLIADRDNDVMFEFRDYRLTHRMEVSDTEYLASLTNFLEYLLKNNYVFIPKKPYSFETDDWNQMVLILKIVTRRKYLFKK